MRILVCGGRDYDDYFRVCKVLSDLFPAGDDIATWLPPDGTVIIHGGARGADMLADQWAVVNWVPIEEYPANWKDHGRAAGHIRNKQMLDEGKPDLVVAFPGGRGTANMIKQAKAAGVEVMIIEE